MPRLHPWPSLVCPASFEEVHDWHFELGTFYCECGAAVALADAEELQHWWEYVAQRTRAILN